MTAAIGQTASITLLTALPGSGKTLRLVGFIKKAIAAGELVYVSNLNGLKVPHIAFPDPREWQDLPTGSVLVVDEAQQFFRARRGGEPPDYITAMETIRHKGVRLVLATQQPNYLDAHLRGLVGLHEHLVRENGKEASKIYRSNEVIEDVRSEKGRSKHDQETWLFPREDFDLYQSAEVHTVKYVMSSRMKKGIIFGALALLLAGGVAYKAKGQYLDPVLSDDATTADGALGAVAAVAAPPATGPSERPLSAAEYAEKLSPRIPGLLYSAPVFDGREAVSQPEVYCISSEAGTDAQGVHQAGSVTCLTEQGTRYVVDEAQGRMYARQGVPYNPFKEPPREAAGPAAALSEGPASYARGDAFTGTVMSAPQIGAYGDLSVPTDAGSAP